MTLLEILKNNKIQSSSEFKQDIEIQEQTFGKWVLVLINDDSTKLVDVIKSLKTITKLKPREAQAIALLAHFKGKAVITNGDGDTILKLAQKFEQNGILVAVANISDLENK